MKLLFFITLLSDPLIWTVMPFKISVGYFYFLIFPKGRLSLSHIEEFKKNAFFKDQVCLYLTSSRSGSGTGEKIWFTEIVVFHSEIPQPRLSQRKELTSVLLRVPLLVWDRGQDCQGNVHTGYQLQIFHFQSLELFASGFSFVAHAFYFFPVQNFLSASEFYTVTHLCHPLSFRASLQWLISYRCPKTLPMEEASSLFHNLLHMILLSASLKEMFGPSGVIFHAVAFLHLKTRWMYDRYYTWLENGNTWLLESNRC